MNPGYYSDGAGILVEGVDGTDISVLAGVALSDGNLIVALGFGSEGKQISFNPYESVMLSTDSAPNMVLYPVTQPNVKIPKSDVTIKKKYKKQAVTVEKGKISAGYLFFPNDNDATQVLIKVSIGGESFEFPFRRSPSFRAKFIPPASGNEGSVVAAEKITPSAPVDGSRSAASLLAVDNPSVSATPVNQTSTTPPQIPPGVSCSRNISIVSAIGGQVTTTPPDSARKWIDKNRKNYPNLCFSQAPILGIPNYLFVMANSQAAFSGIYPTLRSSTTTNTAPVSGNGTITNTYGQTWNYTYNGTTTTTTTTTTQVNLPYTDTTNGLYVYIYDQNGGLVSRHSRSVTTRQGGDGANTFGYNMGAALGAIHIKDRLIKEAVESVKN
jgi:hypothetical protein